MNEDDEQQWGKKFPNSLRSLVSISNTPRLSILPRISTTAALQASAGGFRPRRTFKPGQGLVLTRS
jgi:hypothetical protein